MDWKLYLSYYFTTATGLLTTGTAIGAVQYIVTGDDLFFTVALVGMLVAQSNIENPNIVVIDKEQFLKQQEQEQEEA